jgi:WD40 repeat protein
VWNAENGELVRNFGGHKEAITDCISSTDGLVLVTSSNDKTVRVWNITDGTSISTLTDFEDSVDYVTLSKNQRLFLAVTHAGEIRIINFENDKRFAINTPDKNNCSDTKIAISNDARRLLIACMLYVIYGNGAVVARTAQIGLFDASSGERLISFTGYEDSLVPRLPVFVDSVAFASGDDRILTVGSDETLRVWFAGAIGPGPVSPSVEKRF